MMQERADSLLAAGQTSRGKLLTTLKVVGITLVGALASGCGATSAGDGSPARKISEVRASNPATKTLSRSISLSDYEEALASGTKNQVRLIEVFSTDRGQKAPPEYRMFGVEQGGVYQLLGLQNLDVLVAAGEYVVPSPGLFWQYLQLLRYTKQGIVEIKRNGMPIVLQYNLIGPSSSELAEGTRGAPLNQDSARINQFDSSKARLDRTAMVDREVTSANETVALEEIPRDTELEDYLNEEFAKRTADSSERESGVEAEVETESSAVESDSIKAEVEAEGEAIKDSAAIQIEEASLPLKIGAEESELTAPAVINTKKVVVAPKRVIVVDQDAESTLSDEISKIR